MPRQKAQLEFRGFGGTVYVHGGTLGIGKRKTSRPFSPKMAVHLVFRSSRCRGNASMLAGNRRMLVARARTKAQVLSGANILRFVNVGNHIHVVLTARSLGVFQKFVRIFSGEVARLMTGAKKTQKLVERFWDLPYFSRLVPFVKRMIAILHKYMTKNELEAAGFSLNELIFLREEGYAIWPPPWPQRHLDAIVLP